MFSCITNSGNIGVVQGFNTDLYHSVINKSIDSLYIIDYESLTEPAKNQVYDWYSLDNDYRFFENKNCISMFKKDDYLSIVRVFKKAHVKKDIDIVELYSKIIEDGFCFIEDKKDIFQWEEKRVWYTISIEKTWYGSTYDRETSRFANDVICRKNN